MSKRMKFHENKSCEDEHHTEFHWHLHHWSDLYQGTYKNGFFSEKFLLAGTDGYTCKIHLEPTKEHPLTLILSSTAQILTMDVTFSVPGLKSFEHHYAGPFRQNSFPYFCHEPFDKKNRSFIFNDKKSPTLTIVVNISLTKSVHADFGVEYPSEELINDEEFVFSPEFTKIWDAVVESENSLPDVTLVVGENEFRVHKAILASQSPVFEKMFSTAIKDVPATSRFVISDTEPAVFEKFINFLYTSALTDLNKFVDRLIILADRYEIQSLTIICKFHMLANISEDNVIRFLVVADRLGCTDLRTRAVQMLSANPTPLVQQHKAGNFETVLCVKKAIQRAVEDRRRDLHL